MGCGCCISVAPLCAQKIVDWQWSHCDHRMLEATAGDVGCRDVADLWRKKSVAGTVRTMEDPDRFAVWLVVSNIFFIFHNIWDNHPNWLTKCFKMVKTTNQQLIFLHFVSWDSSILIFTGCEVYPWFFFWQCFGSFWFSYDFGSIKLPKVQPNSRSISTCV